MLKELKVENFVLIKSLDFKPNAGFNILTGETGAGKSIIIGALGLILGERADSKSIMSNESKCIIEGIFDVKNLGLKDLFDSNDLDYADDTIFRREILPSGKSRAFINDTPVSLQILKQFGELVVDIHGQHQSLKLGSPSFLMDWYDVVAETDGLAHEYEVNYKALKTLRKEVDELEQAIADQLAERDYNEFVLKELNELNLDTIDETALDNEYGLLQSGEAIGEITSSAINAISESDQALLDQLNGIARQLERYSNASTDVEEVVGRLKGAAEELGDLVHELRAIADSSQPDPERLAQLEDLMQELHRLKTKHRVATIAELVELRDALNEKLGQNIENESKLDALRQVLTDLNNSCLAKADRLHNERAQALNSIELRFNTDIAQLGLPNAKVSLKLNRTENLSSFGCSTFELLFAANKGGQILPAHKSASGGELSRLMLVLKTLMAQRKNLGLIVLDEIDTGVSGEVAMKMGEMMETIAQGMQVISITHLPQIASKGKSHYFVYKEVQGDETNTHIKELNETDRVIELAKMLSGDNPSSAAIANAKELLN